MKKKFAGLLAVVMSISILAFGSAATALTWNASETFTMKKGETENIRTPGTYGVVNWAKVEPAGVVIITSAGVDGIDVEALNPGLTTMTINSTSYDDNGSVVFNTGTMQILVTDADGNTLGAGEGVHTLSSVANYRVEVGKTITGATHSSIVGSPTVSPSGILTASTVAANVSVDATTAAALGISTTSGQSLTYTGVAPGTATVTYTYRDSGNSTDQKASVIVEVVAPGTITDSTSAMTQNVTLANGSKSKLAQNYFSISGVKSSSPSIVAVKSTGTEGGMNIEIEALKTGTSNITFNYKVNNATETLKQATISVTVRENTNVTSIADTESGIYLTPRKSNATTGKSYRANLRVNGELKDSEADFWEGFVWISTNQSVATIDAKTGWFKVVGKGTTRIICISTDGTMMDAVTVTGK